MSLDPCQTIFKTDNNARLRAFVERSNVVTLSYCYRMSRQLLEHAYSVLTRYAPEYHEQLDLADGIQLPLSVLSGPRVTYLCANSEESLVQAAAKAMRVLRHQYSSPDSLAVIHLQYWSPHFHTRATPRVDPVATGLQADPDCRDISVRLLGVKARSSPPAW